MARPPRADSCARRAQCTFRLACDGISAGDRGADHFETLLVRGRTKLLELVCGGVAPKRCVRDCGRTPVACLPARDDRCGARRLVVGFGCSSWIARRAAGSWSRTRRCSRWRSCRACSWRCRCARTYAAGGGAHESGHRSVCVPAGPPFAPPRCRVLRNGRRGSSERARAWARDGPCSI